MWSFSSDRIMTLGSSVRLGALTYFNPALTRSIGRLGSYSTLSINLLSTRNQVAQILLYQNCVLPLAILQ